jgi:hypothetical protein
MRAATLLLFVPSIAFAAELPIFVDPIPMPEPSTLALLAGAAGVWLLRRIRRRK